MAKTGPLTVVAVSGSLRRGSYNSATLRACQALAPDGLSIEIFPRDRIAEFPLYDDDVALAGLPEPVVDLRERIAAADGLLIANPEYNHSLSSVTKTIIDWVSRPPDQPFFHKPIAILGATTGPMGGPWGQYAVRQCFVSLEGLVMNRPEVFIKTAKERFDEGGTLTDAESKEAVTAFLAAFEGWIRKVGP